GAHEVLHDAVELPTPRRVLAWHAEGRDDSFVEPLVERRLVRRIEQGHAGDQLRGCGVREEVVRDGDAVDETALCETALVEAGPELERGDHDVPAQRLAVDDRPPRAPDLLQEELAERDEVLDEQVRPILSGAIARGGPGVTLAQNVVPQRR